MKRFICLLHFLLILASSSSISHRRHQKCRRIEHEMCNDLPYNLTGFPNLVGEETFKHAAESIATYKPLLSVVCSEQLKFFLCSVYFPMCNEKIAQPIGPCRPLCLSVKEKCLPILQGFGFPWPDAIRCDKFPLENNRDKMCMKGPNENGAIQNERQFVSKAFGDDEYASSIIRNAINGNFLANSRRCAIDEIFINKTGRCVPLCNGSQRISQADRDSATRLLLFLSSSSVILTVLSTFIVIISRFAVLATIADISMYFSCFAFATSSLIYVFSISFRDQVSCTDYTNHLLFVVGGLSHVPCSSVASLIYYSTTVARLWWLLVCFTWNRSTKLSTILESAKSRVHLIVWGVPLGVLMIALIAKSIAANPLTGICLVGAYSMTTDWTFNFIRELALFLASTFGLCSACLRMISSNVVSVNNFAGIVAVFYPICALFYMLAFINDATQPAIGWTRTFNVVSGLKYSFDLVLSLIMSTLCFVYVLSRVAKSPSAKVSKEGYQPAAPNMPQPAIPINTSRTNTYTSSAFRTNLI